MTTRRASLLVIGRFVGVVGATASAATEPPISDRNTKSAVVVTATWIGPAAGGLWSDPANWDTVDFPNNGNAGLNYDVFITSPVNAPTVIHLDTDVVIESLFQRGTIDAQSVPANMTINGPWDWQGVILGPGTTRANGGITNPTFSIGIQIGGGRILENAGLATSLKFILADGAQFDNLAGGTISFQPFHTIGIINGGVLNNFGLLQVDSTLFVKGVFNNHGLVDVRGSLHLRSSGTQSGEFRVAELASLFVEPDTGTNVFTETSNITGLGGVRFTGAEAVNLNGGFALSGLTTAAVPALTFANAPTGTGFSLEVGSTFGPPTVVRFEAGVPALDALTVPPPGTLHIVGDANVSGALRWDGTMSGSGTTTTHGLVRAIQGLTLDGRTLIAVGGFRWQGADFVLDNGAVFQNAEGSTFDINLNLRRSNSILSNTPANPGRMVNAGIITQTESRLATIKVDWQQTSTGVTTVDRLVFRANTDISGSMTNPRRSGNAITFAGPDTGGTITHRLNPDSTLTVLGTVNVGDPNASGSDIINAEFAGTVDFSSVGSSLGVHGANTTLTLAFPTRTGTTAAGPVPAGIASFTVDSGADVAIVSTIGACCKGDGTCFLTSAFLCEERGGQPQGGGSGCQPNPCGTGACCFADGNCRLVPVADAQSECTDTGGEYLGDHSICESCNPGACCLPNAECVQAFVIDCTLRNGRFLGEDTICLPDLCGPVETTALDIGHWVMGDASVVFDPGSAIVSGETLIVTGTSSVDWVGEQPGIWDIDALLFRFPGVLTVGNTNLVATDPRPCEVDFGFGVNAVKAGTVSLIGPDQGEPTVCFLGARGKWGSSDQTGTALFDGVDLRFGGTDDPVDWFEVSLPATLRNTTIERQFDSAPHTTTVWKDVTFEGDIEIDGVTVIVTDSYSDTGAGIDMCVSGIAFNLDEQFSPAARAIIMLESSVGLQSADGSPIAEVAGTGEFRNPFFLGCEGCPSSTFGSVGGVPLLSFGTSGLPNDIVHAVISPGDTRPNGVSTPAQAGIGTLTMTGRNAVIDNGSVLRADIDPPAVGQRNDRFEIIATTTVFAASLRVSLAPGSECAVLPTDAFTVVTGTAITYPNGGDGRRVLATGGEGSFVVNQGLTGIVLDQFLLGADGNLDRSVDALDTAGFIPCLLGPDGSLTAGCDPFDFDFDGDGDLKDFSVLQKRFGTTCP